MAAATAMEPKLIPSSAPHHRSASPPTKMKKSTTTTTQKTEKKKKEEEEKEKEKEQEKEKEKTKLDCAPSSSAASMAMAKPQGAEAEQLDYSIPLLSVRRYRSEGDQWKTSGKKPWKLSAELSREPLRIPGSVPFQWERTPGQPKLLGRAEAPSPSPSTSSASASASSSSSSSSSSLSDQNPSLLPPAPDLHTPSDHKLQDQTTPSSANLATDLPISPRIKPLLPAPPPPPPPPPLLRMHSAPPPRSIIKSPSPSPSHLPPNVCRDRIQSTGFCFFDPTTDSSFRQILLERRKLAEPDLEVTSDAASSNDNPNPNSLDSNEPGEVEIQGDQDQTCVRKPLLSHGDASSSPEVVEAEVIIQVAEPESMLGSILKEQESISTADQIPVDDDSTPAIAEVEAIRTAAPAVANDLPSNASTPDVVALDEKDGSSESYQQGNAGDAVLVKPRINDINVEDSAKSIARRDSAPNTEAMAKPGASVEALYPENAMEADRRAKRIWTIGRNHESVDYTCGSLMDAESLRRIKCAVNDACRKAAAASARALAQAKNKVLIPAANTVNASLSVFLRSHSCVRSSAQTHAKCGGEENVSATLEVKPSAMAEERQRDQLSIASSSSSSVRPDPLPRSIDEGMQKDLTSMNPDSRKNRSEIVASPDLGLLPSPSKTLENHNSVLIRSPPINSTPSNPADVSSDPIAKKSLVSPVLRESSLSSNYEDARSSSTQNREISSSASSMTNCGSAVASPVPASPDNSGNSRRFSTKSSSSSSSRQFRSKSIGGDQELQDELFHDAPNRLNGSISQGSTPGRNTASSVLSSAEEDFADATASPFQTPRSSLSGSSYSRRNPYLKSYSAGQSPSRDHSNREFVRRISNSKLQSKLSQRLGKALRLDMEDLAVNKTIQDGSIHAQKPSDAAMHTASSAAAVKVKEHTMNAGARRFLSGEQTQGPMGPRRQLTRKEEETTADDYRSRAFSRLPNSSVLPSVSMKNALFDSSSVQKLQSVLGSGSSVSVPVFPAKCQKNRLKVMSGPQQKMFMNSNVDKDKILYMALNVADVGWPLGISGYPEALMVNSKKKGASKPANPMENGLSATKSPSSASSSSSSSAKQVRSNLAGAVANVVPLPPVPPLPAGGSWLKKALSSSSYKHQETVMRSANVKPRSSCSNGRKKLGEEMKEEEEEEVTEASPIIGSSAAASASASASAKSSWEAMVRGSHVRPGHLRFSEEFRRQYVDLD